MNLTPQLKMRSSLVFYQAKQKKIKKIEEIALLLVFSPYFGILFQNEICTKKSFNSDLK